MLPLLICSTATIPSTVKPALVATSIKQATCYESMYSFPEKGIYIKMYLYKQAPVLSKHIVIIP